jgi:hypothetical protein
MLQPHLQLAQNAPKGIYLPQSPHLLNSCCRQSDLMLLLRAGMLPPAAHPSIEPRTSSAVGHTKCNRGRLCRCRCCCCCISCCGHCCCLLLPPPSPPAFVPAFKLPAKPCPWFGLELLVCSNCPAFKLSCSSSSHLVFKVPSELHCRTVSAAAKRAGRWVCWRAFLSAMWPHLSRAAPAKVRYQHSMCDNSKSEFA